MKKRSGEKTIVIQLGKSFVNSNWKVKKSSIFLFQ